jgi:apolipoprotein D and lipocalin family protein
MTCPRLSALALCVWSALLAPASGEEVRAVPHVDLPRYAGQWFEVARFPNWFQKKCAGDVAVIYSLRDDGRLTVDNRCHNAGGGTERAVGVARLATKDGSNSKLKVRFAPSALSFLPFVWADYWVIDLADDYSHAIVGTPNRDYLWFLSRTPTVSPELYDRLVQAAAAQGFDTSRLQRTTNSGQVPAARESQ